MKENKKVNKENEEKLRILDKYCAFAGSKNRHPSVPELQKLGIERHNIRHYFGNHGSLKRDAQKHDPDAFDNIVDSSLFTPKAFQRLREEAGKFDRYFVTTAAGGCKVHEQLWSTIESFSKKKSALPLILPVLDPAAKAGGYIDPTFRESAIVFNDLALNDNLFVSSIKLSAKHIDPITGLSRIGQRNGSFIYASPKQRLKMTPTSNVKLPHAMMTTGAVTIANYTTDRYMSERTAYIATHDHVMGGIIVEVVDDKLFHYRQVQADRRGQFIDLAVLYKPDGKTEIVRPEALVLGDWHSGETDPQARAAFIGNDDSVMNVTKPKRLVIHDGFNGRSISHHEVKDRVLRAQRAAHNQLSLEYELTAYAQDLEALASPDFIEEVVIVYSNHDDFLYRYLADARYVEDPQNHHLALKLAQAAVEGKNPIQAFIETRKLKNGSKLRWLKLDEDYKIANIEIGAHGHKGANGARGSLRAMENAYGQSVSGHAHTPEILRGAWQTGTLSLLKLNYNQGPSSWLHTSCLIYPNGARQLINVIAGEWRLSK